MLLLAVSCLNIFRRPFPIPDSTKAKTPKTNQSSVFFNRVASQTPGTDASEWAAGFRP